MHFGLQITKQCNKLCMFTLLRFHFILLLQFIVCETRHIGDRIAVPHHVSCGTCRLCRSGNPTMCDTFRDNLMEPGGFADYVLIRDRATAEAAHKVPDGISDAAAVFMEPAACVLRGVEGLVVWRWRSAACCLNSCACAAPTLALWGVMWWMWKTMWLVKLAMRLVRVKWMSGGMSRRRAFASSGPTIEPTRPDHAVCVLAGRPG